MLIRISLSKITITITQNTFIIVSTTKQRAIIIRVSLSKTIIKKPFTNVITITHVFLSNQFDLAYRLKHIDAQNALIFTSIKIKKYYDFKHKFIFFKIDDYVYLHLYRNY